LNKLKQKIKYPEKEIAEFFVCLIKGLNYLAKHGYIHRDIKLENMLLKNAEDLESLKICDFGLVIHKDDL